MKDNLYYKMAIVPKQWEIYFEFYLIEWFAINPSTSCWSSKCSIFLQYVSFTTEFMLLLYVSEFYI